MTQADFVDVIGKLLSDCQFREQFRQAPEQTVGKLDVDPSVARCLLNLDVRQLEHQSETLLNKRWHAARKLIPKTIKELGDEARDLFQFYATSNWPEGHRRHTQDAYQFLQFLTANRIHQPSGRELKRLQKLQ